MEPADRGRFPKPGTERAIGACPTPRPAEEAVLEGLKAASAP
jgi:hypothetical protein